MCTITQATYIQGYMPATSGPKLHRGNISIMHLMNGENGKIIGACTFLLLYIFQKKVAKNS